MFIFIGLCWGQPLRVKAESTSAPTVFLEDNKISSSNKDIIFTPQVGQTYQFEIKVTNNSEQEVEIKAFTSQAISKNKTISYEEGESEHLVNKSYHLAQYVKLLVDQKELDTPIMLKAYEEKKLQVHIQIPRDFEGEMLGGINVAQVLKTAEGTVNTEHVYQQVIVVRLKGEEIKNLTSQDHSTFNFKSHGEKLFLSYVNTNPNGKLVYAHKGSYQLKNPKQKVIAEGKLDHLVVLTPHTRTHFNLPLTSTDLLSGKYTFITIIDGEKKTYTFTYSEAELKALAKTNKTMQKKQAASDQKFLILCLSAVVALLVVVLAVVIIKNRKKQRK